MPRPGTIDRRVDFPAGARLGGNGFYLVGNPTGLASHYQVVPDLGWGDDSLENGSQTLAVVSTASLGDVGTLVTGTETVHDAVGLTDAGPADRWFWTAPVLGPDDGFLPGGARRFTDGVDTDAVSARGPMDEGSGRRAGFERQTAPRPGIRPRSSASHGMGSAPWSDGADGGNHAPNVTGSVASP